MPDAGWQELERSWRARPGDQDLLARAIAARRRVSQAVPWDMLQARRYPARSFASAFPFQVWLEDLDGTIDVAGRTGRQAVQVPPHKSWWVEPAASCEDLDELVDALAEGEVPGLALSQATLGAEVLEVLAKLPQLERLSFLQCRGLDAGSLTPLTRFANLTELALVFCPGVDDHALQVIGQLTGLVELNLAGAPLSDEGVVRLEGLRELAALNLASAVFGDRGLEVLSRLPQLRKLRAQAADVTADGLQALRAAERLEALDLDASGLQAEDLACLQAWPGLRELGLERCEGLEASAWSYLPHVPQLQVLALEQASSLGDVGLRQLGALSELSELVLSGAGVTAAGLSLLAALPLESLILSECPRLSEGDLLGALRPFARLRSLSLTDCGLGWEDVDALRRGLPHCEVEWV